MNERRKIERRFLIYYLRIYDRNTDEFIGNLFDITVKGMMLMGEVEIESDKEFQFRMIMNDEFYEENVIEFEATSIRSFKSPESSFYHTGFKFTKINSENAGKIKILIDKLGIRES